MRSNRLQSVAAVFLPLLAACVMAAFVPAGRLSAETANWPQFRGPSARGVADVEGLPTTWSDDENVVWKTALPGYGASSPIAWGDRIFVTAYSGYGTDESDGADPSDLKRHVVCLSGDGEILWDTKIGSEPGERSYRGFVALHGYASHTPVTDGERVYAYFGKTGAVAVDIDSGKVLWQTDCGDQTHGFGTAASPVLFDDLLIVNAGVESGKLFALDKASGEVVWSGGNINRAWSTPLLLEVEGRAELIISMENRIVAYDPKTGADLWHCDAIEDYICPSVIAHDGIVYAIGGRGRIGLAVRAGGKGDVTDTHKLWEIRRGSNVSSPVYHQGRLYWVHESNGICYCADAKTGDILYEERLRPSPGRIYASPLVADGKIYYVSRDNGAYVLATGDEFKLLAHNAFESDDSIFNASPIVFDGDLLLRSNENLYRVGKE